MSNGSSGGVTDALANGPQKRQSFVPVPETTAQSLRQPFLPLAVPPPRPPKVHAPPAGNSQTPPLLPKRHYQHRISISHYSRQQSSSPTQSSPSSLPQSPRMPHGGQRHSIHHGQFPLAAVARITVQSPSRTFPNNASNKLQPSMTAGGQFNQLSFSSGGSNNSSFGSSHCIHASSSSCSLTTVIETGDRSLRPLRLSGGGELVTTTNSLESPSPVNSSKITPLAASAFNNAVARFSVSTENNPNSGQNSPSPRKSPLGRSDPVVLDDVLSVERLEENASTDEEDYGNCWQVEPPRKLTASTYSSASTSSLAATSPSNDQNQKNGTLTAAKNDNGTCGAAEGGKGAEVLAVSVHRKMSNSSTTMNIVQIHSPNDEVCLSSESSARTLGNGGLSATTNGKTGNPGKLQHQLSSSSNDVSAVVRPSPIASFAAAHGITNRRQSSVDVEGDGGDTLAPLIKPSSLCNLRAKSPMLAHLLPNNSMSGSSPGPGTLQRQLAAYGNGPVSGIAAARPLIRQQQGAVRRTYYQQNNENNSNSGSLELKNNSYQSPNDRREGGSMDSKHSLFIKQQENRTIASGNQHKSQSLNNLNGRIQTQPQPSAQTRNRIRYASLHNSAFSLACTGPPITDFRPIRHPLQHQTSMSSVVSPAQSLEIHPVSEHHSPGHSAGSTSGGECPSRCSPNPSSGKLSQRFSRSPIGLRIDLNGISNNSRPNSGREIGAIVSGSTASLVRSGRESSASPRSFRASQQRSGSNCSTVYHSTDDDGSKISGAVPIHPRQAEIVCERRVTAVGDGRLQQSLSTPAETYTGEDGFILCGPGGAGGGRKESEYRRFRSEGSTTVPCAGASAYNPLTGPLNGKEITGMVAGDHHLLLHDDLSPIDATPMTASAHHRSSPPNRLNLFQAQDTLVNGCPPMNSKHKGDEVMLMHTLKTKLQKYQGFIDKAMQLVEQNSEEQVIEGCTIIIKVLTKAWAFPKISHDLAHSLCDYFRENNYLETVLNLFVKPNISDSIRVCSGRVIEETLCAVNRELLVSKGYLRRVITTAETKLNKSPEQQRLSLALMDILFRHSTDTSSKMLEFGVLDHILLTCKRATGDIRTDTLRHAALAFANLTIFSCPDSKKKFVQKKLPDWLFLLASNTDDITRYYACLAICVLASSAITSKEMESAVNKSGTLALVEPFLSVHRPVDFSENDFRNSQNRSKEWLTRLLPLLGSKCREAKSMAAFHLCMEAVIKKELQKLEVLEEIGAIEKLKECASSPDELAAQFASEALTIIGEEVPYKLTQQVPCWSTKDVQMWVDKIGFAKYGPKFVEHMVDGDLLLMMNEKELHEDLGMSSGLLRKRFMRELESLKIAADYSSVDETHLDQFLMSLSPELSVYTYQMLRTGLNRNLLPQLLEENCAAQKGATTNKKAAGESASASESCSIGGRGHCEDLIQTVCGIQNPIHGMKLRQALQNSKHIEDIEVAILSKQIDVFISYRRSTGNQLASLIKVLLQLRGYKVFIDVDKLYAGKFDSHLLKNIQAAKHFVIVLTPHSLDRLLNDHNREDWIHKELHCAFEHQKNVIPIFDQGFEFPLDESELPEDIRQITKFNGVRWVHDYQEACIDKVERFIKGELNRIPSLNAARAAAAAYGSPTGGHHHHVGSPGTGAGGGRGSPHRAHHNQHHSSAHPTTGRRTLQQQQNNQHKVSTASANVSATQQQCNGGTSGGPGPVNRGYSIRGAPTSTPVHPPARPTVSVGQQQSSMTSSSTGSPAAIQLDPIVVNSSTSSSSSNGAINGGSSPSPKMPSATTVGGNSSPSERRKKLYSSTSMVTNGDR